MTLGLPITVLQSSSDGLGPDLWYAGKYLFQKAVFLDLLLVSPNTLQISPLITIITRWLVAAWFGDSQSANSYGQS